MIRKPIIAAVICLLLGFAVSIANDGCRPYCDSLPDESPASVRILNAVSNVDILLIYIDGKLFDRAYYDINTYSTFGLSFGYRNKYISDGSTLRAGQHHIVAIASGGGIAPDTVFQKNYILYDHRQSIIGIGKLNGTPSQTPTTIYLDDVLRGQQARSAARFIHAVPDLAGIDVYFKNLPTPPPDIRIHYGRISDNQGGDNGTGLSANDYFEFPSPVPGLVITPVGDTAQGDIITNFPYSLNTSDFLATIVVRGETKPVGNEPTVSTLVMQDGSESNGTYSFNIPSFNLRLVNATRIDSLSLLIYRVGDHTYLTGDRLPRSNYPSAGGALNIPSDSVGNYIPLNPALASTYYFWYATEYTPLVLIDSFSHSDTASERLTFIAIDTIPHNTGVVGIDTIILSDNYLNTTDPTKGRLRFVNTTSDYNPRFTFGGKQLNMRQRDVIFADTTTGPCSIDVSDGNGNTATIMLDVSSSMPQTVFFMPSNANGSIVYRISTP